MSEAGHLRRLVDEMVQSYESDARGQRIGRKFSPSRDEILDVLRLLLELFYPGYYGRQDLTRENVVWHVGTLLTAVRAKLEHQVELCLCHDIENEPAVTPDVPRCRAHGRTLTDAFLDRLPEIRRRLVLDIQAAHDGDPAASNLHEIVLAYPGLLAVTVYRIAHELHTLGVPLMPRIMTEWAHAVTGADIHPGAVIGHSFFLDHATGCVIGATTVIGDRVKLYQGVTLGALSFPRDGVGRLIRGTKRHPTVEDDVTIYANATVLGGETVLGHGSVIGGSVFITRSVPEGHRVALKAPELRVATPLSADGSTELPPGAEFDI